MQTVQLDAPIGGWNAFDSLDNMPPTDAIILDNLIPGTGSVDTRLGTIVYADLTLIDGTLTGAVETVATYFTRSDSKLIAACEGGVYDITDPDASAFGRKDGVEAQAINVLHPKGTFMEDRWQTANFRKQDEEGVLLMCNGVDDTHAYNGTTMDPIAFTDDAETPNPIDADFIGCVVFKGRAYYWYDNDDSFWYAQAGAYQGVMGEFDLGTFVQEGGKIMFCTTWTQQDSGDGKDDFFVVVFDTGEIIVYQGDAPDVNWEQVGRYQTAEPLSIRGHEKYGSDRIIMTRDGYVNLSSIIQRGRTSDVPQFSRKISGAIKRETALRGGLYGWDCELFQKKGLFFFNVPLQELSRHEQHVLNTVTGAWCRFTDINVNCLEVHDERLFGGSSDAKVYAIMETTADLGGAIVFTALPAYQTFGNAGVQKHMTAIMPLTTNTTPTQVSLQGYADYDVPDLLPVYPDTSLKQADWSIDPVVPPTWADPGNPSNPPLDPGVPAALGDFWALDQDDPNGAYWSNDFTPYTTKGWHNISAYGFAVSYIFRFAKIDEQVIWRSTNLRLHQAGAQ